MTDNLQPGQHLDADTLSAFAESALPAHERQQAIAHLAVCGHCRGILSLALPPMEAAPRPQIVPARRPWFASWKLALPTVGFAVAAVAVFLLAHRHSQPTPANTPTLTAKNEVPTPAPAHPAPSTTAAPALAKMPPPPTPKPLQPPPASEPIVSLEAESNAGATTIDNLKIQDLPINGRNTVALKPVAPVAAASGAVLSQAAPMPTANSAVAGAPKALAPPPPAPQPPADVTEVAADAVLSARNAAPSAVRLASPLRSSLPGGRAILSTIARNNQTLALDTAGALFVSLDSGAHWKAVPTQWQGRAVKLTLAGYPPPLADRATLDAYAGKAIGGPLTGTAAIIGTVTDSTGAVIGGASLVLKDASASILRSIKVNASGNYTLEGLAAGAYTLEASSPGFDESRTITTLAAGQRLPLNLVLKPGSASETVTVTAEAPVLETQSVARKRASDKATAKPEPRPTPPGIFELTTDTGEHWTSPDGQNWKHN